MNTNIGLLETFVTVFRAGTLTEAARRLGITQPAVSGQLKRLEAALGMALFERTTAGVMPTRDAISLMGRVAPHVDALQVSRTSAPADVMSGTVRIGGASDILSLRIVPCLSPLLARGLQLNAIPGQAPDLLENLASGALDLVVSSLRPKDSALAATPWLDEEFVLVGAPSWTATVDQSRLDDDAPAALAHIPLLAYAEDLQIIRRYWLTEFEQRPANTVSLTLPDLRGIREAVLAGAGMSVLPRYVVERDLGDGGLQLLHAPVYGPLNTLYLVTAAGAPGSDALGMVQARLAEQAGSWVSL